MRERDVRAWLRGATGAKEITGWYVTGEVFDRAYHVNDGGAMLPPLTDGEMVDLILDRLWPNGVEPLYRDSEPDFELAA